MERWRTAGLWTGVPAWLRAGRSVRWAVGLCVFHLVLIWTVAALVIEQDYRRSVDVWKTTASNLAVTMAAQGAQAQAAADLVLKSIVAWVTDENFHDDRAFRDVMAGRRFFDDMRDRILGLPQVGGAAIIAADGELVNSTAAWPALTLNLADRESFQLALRESPSSIVVSATVANRANGDRRFYQSRKVVGASGETLGVVSVGLEARFFADFYRRVALGPDSWVSLFRDDGTLLATSLSDQDLLGRRIDDATTRPAMLVERSGTAELVDGPSPFDPSALNQAGSRRIVAAAGIEGFPTYVVVVVGESMFVAPWRGRSLAIIVIAAVLTALTVAAGLYILRMIERTRVAARAASEQAVLSAIVDTPTALTAVLDRSGNIVRANAAFRRLLGFAGEIGMESAAASPALKGTTPLLDFLRGSDTVGEVTLELARPPDQTRHLHFSLSRQSLSDTGDCVIMVGHDETRRYQAERSIALSGKLVTLGEVTTGIAHELSQPLNVIRMAAQNALVEAKPETGSDLPPAMCDREYREFSSTKLTRIMAQVDRAAAIISRMRIFSRSTRDGPRAYDVRDACSAAVALMAQPYRAAGISVREDLGQQPLRTVGHQVLLEQVLVNLLSNARDALADGAQQAKSVEISAAPGKDGRPRIRVRDNGPGVPEANRERIFEPFFTTKPEGQGIGLGLAVAYGIVRDAGGSLTLLASGPGACFEIDLPGGGPAGEAAGEPS